MSTIDIELYIGFITGKHVPIETKTQYKFKKMAARLRKPLTTKILLNDAVEDVAELRSSAKLKKINRLPDTEFIRATDLYECVPMSNVTLTRMANQGDFPRPFKKEHQSVLYKVKEVQHWLDTQRKYKINYKN